MATVLDLYFCKIEISNSSILLAYACQGWRIIDKISLPRQDLNPYLCDSGTVVFTPHPRRPMVYGRWRIRIRWIDVVIDALRPDHPLFETWTRGTFSSHAGSSRMGKPFDILPTISNRADMMERKGVTCTVVRDRIPYRCASKPSLRKSKSGAHPLDEISAWRPYLFILSSVLEGSGRKSNTGRIPKKRVINDESLCSLSFFTINVNSYFEHGSKWSIGFWFFVYPFASNYSPDFWVFR